MAFQPHTVRTTTDIHEQLRGQSAQVLVLLGIDTDAIKKHVRCPLGTHPDNHPSFRLNPARDRYFCSCTPRGASLVDLVIQTGAATGFRDAVAFLRSHLGLGGAAVAFSGSHSALNGSTHSVQRSPLVAPPKSKPQTGPAEFERVLSSCTSPGRHAYLARKRIAPIEAVLDPNTRRLVLRIHDAEGQTVGLQFIAEDGSKRCAEGSKLAGNGLILGDHKANDLLAVTEGWATGVTIYSLTNRPVLVTFGAANMAAALQRFLLPGQKALIFADNDTAGRSAAIEARALVGKNRCSIVIPKVEGLDFNDLHVRASQIVSQQAMSGNPAEDSEEPVFSLVHASALSIAALGFGSTVAPFRPHY